MSGEASPRRKTHAQEAAPGHGKRVDKEVLQPLKGTTERYSSDVAIRESLARVSVRGWTRTGDRGRSNAGGMVFKEAWLLSESRTRGGS